MVSKRRMWLAALGLAGCEKPNGETPTTTNPTLPTGLILFSVDFVAGRTTGLPNRSQVALILGEHATAQGGPIARTLPGPGRFSGQDVTEGSLSLGRLYAVNLPARPHSIGRIFVEPTDLITQRTTYILPPLIFTPRPGRALYLGNLAILPHTWQPTREPGIQPSSHRALRDLGVRDIPLLRAREAGLAGMEIDTLSPPPPGWPSRLPPPEAWPVGNTPIQARSGPTAPPYYGAPNQPLAPPGTPVRPLGQPAPPPGFGPPGVAPGRFGRGAAQ